MTDLHSSYTIYKSVRLLVEYIGVTVSCPGFQPAGHTSPCSSVYWKAWTNRSVSSTLRPTGKSFIVIWRNIPRPSIMKRPLSTHFNRSDYNSVRCNGQFTECNKQTSHGWCSRSRHKNDIYLYHQQITKRQQIFTHKQSRSCIHNQLFPGCKLLHFFT